MARDLVETEQRGEHVLLAAIFRAKGSGFIASQSGRRGRAPVGQYRQQGRAGPGMLEHGWQHLGIDAPINRVEDAIGARLAQLLILRCCKQRLAGACERDFDGVIHPAGDERLEGGAIRPAAKHVVRGRDERRLAFSCIGFTRMSSLAPVDHAVGTEVWAANSVRTTPHLLIAKPFLTTIGHAVAVCIRQLPDRRRRADVERAVEPEASLRQHHPVGKHGPLVETAVAVGVFQAQDTVGPGLELTGKIGVGARSLRHIQPPFFIEIGADGIHDERLPGRQLDREALGQAKAIAVEPDLTARGQCVVAPNQAGGDRRSEECCEHEGVFHRFRAQSTHHAPRDVPSPK